ncbi:hypothetical protein QR680_015940 [Steinernema hermaphroditum]|uniref:7TM GPCR serpentine receptor class x (Srx) domain-containing protein n=1 Tax=Steinernema hermaphroditum TaxID=289476 RepID=A0AA39H9H1_9BILA|nr:hypothetical protein QR680_015940 [Steinernema hermaphroditum]
MEAPSEPTTDRHIAVSMLIVLGTTGFLVNLFAIYGIKKSTTFGASFGRLCISQCLGNCSNCATAAFIVGTITLVKPEFHTTYWGARSAQLLTFFFYGDFFSHFFAALNRLCAIRFPIKYAVLFSPRNTNIALALCWLCAAIEATPKFFSDCMIYFDVNSLGTTFTSTACNSFMEIYFNFYLDLAFNAMIFLCDVFTLVNLRSATKHNTHSTELKKKKFQQDVRFFFQTLCQAAVGFIEVLCFFVFSNMVESRFAKFMLTTFAWMLQQTLDGAMIIFFNKELRSIRLKITVVSVPSAKFGQSTQEARRPPQMSDIL